MLSQRYIELLKNDRGNLAILLLQAPIIGLLLLLFIQGVGTDGFNANAVLQCPTTAMIVAAKGYPDVPTPDNPIVSKSCQHVKDFLTLDARGQAYAKVRGGATKALQDFILPGVKYAPTILFLMAFSAIMFGCINAIREIVKEVPIYRRERTINLGILPYMFSKIAVLGVTILNGVKHTLSYEWPSQAASPEGMKGRHFLHWNVSKSLFSLFAAKTAIIHYLYDLSVYFTPFNMVTPGWVWPLMLRAVYGWQG